MITLVYRLIVLLTAILVLSELFSQASLKLKLNAALVLVPLVLRALMIA
ncbi:MAG TPA: hypothetical protein VN436_17295 [Holophaga sp.]|nr:hypothetical protein [Holophaga sp.]